MLVTDFVGLGGVALTTGAVVLALPGLRRLGRTARAVLLILLLLVLLWPLTDEGLAAAAYVRGVCGDLSVTTLVLSLASVVRTVSGRALFEEGDRRWLLGFVVILAALLYPLALGRSAFDPYRLGYGNLGLIAALILAALAAWRLRLELLPLSVALALLAWALGIEESPNLWDYLLDPLLAVYAGVALMAWSVRKIISRRGALPSPADQRTSP